MTKATLETMSITRALAEVKLLDKRIEKTISQASFVTHAKASQKNVSKNVTKEQFENQSKASLQSVRDLIDRRSRIKSAIAVSNATVDVVVSDKKYKVAEAIARKNSIEHEQLLVFQIRSQLSRAKSRMEEQNDSVNRKLQELLISMVGKDNVKNASEESNKMANQYLADNEYELVDGLNAELLAMELEEEIDDFLFEVDFALSQSNTLTEIEI